MLLLKTLAGKLLSKVLVPICVLLCIGSASFAQCTLGPGDLVFTGYNLLDDGTDGTTTDDSFSFLLLKDVPAGQVIYFTDLGWTGTSFQTANMAVSDAVLKWTADVAYTAGTEIIVYCKYTLQAKDINGVPRGVISVAQPSYNTTSGAVNPAEQMSLAEFSGDQIFAFTNTIAAPTFLAGISVNRASGLQWDASLSAATFGADKSVKPASLTTGAQNLGISKVDPDDPLFNAAFTARYIRTNMADRIGLPAALLAKINDPVRWDVKTNGDLFSPLYPPAEIFSITGITVTTQPVDRLKICPNAATSFTVVASNACSYQWEVSDDGTNFTPIVAGGVYTTVNTATLNISNVSTLNNKKYRVKISGIAGVTSNVVTLTVADPIIEMNAGPLPPAIPNVAYSGSVTVVSGGSGTYTYVVSSGTLPTGLSLGSTTGLITGTPTVGGTSNFSIKATDNCSPVNTATKAYSIIVGVQDQTITLTDYSKIYGDATFTLPATSSAGLTISYSSNAQSVATVSGNTVTIVGAGTAQITANQSGNASYNPAPTVVKTITVTPAALTITVNNQTKVYGATVPGLSASYSGFVNGETPLNLTTLPTLTTTATAASAVAGSPYVINGSGAASPNYAISYVAGSLSVTPALLTITANNHTKVYGAPVPTLTASYNGLVNGDTPASITTPPTFVTSATSASSVAGSPYAITVSNAASTNYAITYVPGSLTVTAAPLTITADNKSKVYGAVMPTLTASYAGFVNGDTEAGLTTAPTLTTTATVASTVAGSPYAITASGAVASNYAITYVPGSLTVNAAPLIITANNQTKAYGAAIPTLTVSYAGFVNGDTGASLTTAPTLTTPATAASSVAGSPYAITASGAVNPNYTISYVPGSLTVTKVALTITANNKSKVYGAPVPTLTAGYAGFVNGDTEADLTTAPTFSTTATASSSVAGSPYAITASGAVNPNYTISYVPGVLTITKAALTVSADNQSKVYGAVLPTLTASYAGFVNGDTEANLTTPPILTTTATAASSVAGSPYAITASGAVASNYAISYAPGVLTITKAALVVTADNQTKVYGAAMPILTASYAGFVNGDTKASLTTAPTLTTIATAASSVAGSPYAITASGAVASNYTISYAPGVLTVTEAALTITADNQSKVYGAALPALTASYAGFVNGDTEASLTTAPTLTTTATATSSVAGSPYAITASGAVASNYTISYAPGVLTITKAVLTVTANNQSKVYGAALPILTASYTGFVNGDTEAGLATAPTLTTTATAASSVAGSPYTITASGAVNPNYTITYTPGVLTITKAALTITADNQSKVYGATLPTLTASYAGFVNGDTEAGLATAPTLSTTATAASSVAGSPYAIMASAAVNPNYTISYAPGVLTITKAALIITADNQSKAYGAALPTLTASYAGFVNGDTKASLTTPPTLTTTATATSSVAGSPYAITASGAVNSNYTISYVPGVLTVTKGVLTITADNQTKVYGAALPTLTASYTGFVNGDTETSLTTPPTLTTTATATSSVGGSPYTITASGAVNPN